MSVINKKDESVVDALGPPCLSAKDEIVDFLQLCSVQSFFDDDDETMPVLPLCTLNKSNGDDARQKEEELDGQVPHMPSNGNKRKKKSLFRLVGKRPPRIPESPEVSRTGDSMQRNKKQGKTSQKSYKPPTLSGVTPDDEEKREHRDAQPTTEPSSRSEKISDDLEKRDFYSEPSKCVPEVIQKHGATGPVIFPSESSKKQNDLKASTKLTRTRKRKSILKSHDVTTLFNESGGTELCLVKKDGFFRKRQRKSEPPAATHLRNNQDKSFHDKKPSRNTDMILKVPDNGEQHDSQLADALVSPRVDGAVAEAVTENAEADQEVAVEPSAKLTTIEATPSKCLAPTMTFYGNGGTELLLVEKNTKQSRFQKLVKRMAYGGKSRGQKKAQVCHEPNNESLELSIQKSGAAATERVVEESHEEDLEGRTNSSSDNGHQEPFREFVKKFQVRHPSLLQAKQEIVELTEVEETLQRLEVSSPGDKSPSVVEGDHRTYPESENFYKPTGSNENHNNTNVPVVKTKDTTIATGASSVAGMKARGVMVPDRALIDYDSDSDENGSVASSTDGNGSEYTLMRDEFFFSTVVGSVPYLKGMVDSQVDQYEKSFGLDDGASFAKNPVSPSDGE